jgi:flagellar biosynthesis protein FliR
MIISVAQAQFFFLALTRILAALVTIPVLGGNGIPAQVRIGFGIVLTLVIVPWQPLPASTEAMGFIGFAVSILKELIIGTLISFAATLTFGAVQIVGSVMGIGSGFESGRIFNPAFQDPGSAFDQLFTIIAMVLFLVIDGHHLVIIALAKTFEVIPVNGPLPIFATWTVIARMTSQLILAGIQIALPIMAALTIADIALGLVARVAPQLQIYFLGLPLKVGISLFGFGTLLLVIFPILNNLYGMLGNRMLQLIGK